jgi:hypothetical protein
MAAPASPLDWLRGQVSLLEKAMVHYLEKKEKNLSLAQKKACLVVFLVTFGGFYVHCLVSGLAGRSSPTVKVTPIKRPLVQHQLRPDSTQHFK